MNWGEFLCYNRALLAIWQLWEIAVMTELGCQVAGGHLPTSSFSKITGIFIMCQIYHHTYHHTNPVEQHVNMCRAIIY